MKRYECESFLLMRVNELMEAKSLLLLTVHVPIDLMSVGTDTGVPPMLRESGRHKRCMGRRLMVKEY